MHAKHLPLLAFLMVNSICCEIVDAQQPQPTWREVLPVNCLSPGPRLSRSIAYDEVRNRVVLFGGAGTGSTIFGDTWEYDDTVWQEQFPPTSPPARYGHAMVYDVLRQKVVMFGGRIASARFNDMWLWDGMTWQQQTTALQPSPRNSHAMAYDPVRNRIVLFGGQVGVPLTTQANDETWEFDGAVWVQLSPLITSPTARMQHSLVYDVARGECVLFGGYDIGNPNMGDTWTWNGLAWTQEAPATMPLGRRSHAMAYDAPRQKMVMAHGLGYPDPTYLTDTWEWNGASWAVQSVMSPPVRYESAMVGMSTLRAVLLFGGGTSTPSGRLGDTWEYSFFARCDAVGSGCPGSLGMPVLTCVTPPIIGTQCVVEVGPVPVTCTAFAAYGGSQVPPLSLAGVGMPSCFLYVANPQFVVLPGSGTSRQFAIFIPQSPALLGLRLTVQMGATDPAANMAGLITSNSVELFIGAR